MGSFLDWLIGKYGRQQAKSLEETYAQLAKQIRETKESHAADAFAYAMSPAMRNAALDSPSYIHPSKFWKGAPMAEKIVFTVYSAANGFYAKLPGGQIVVGMTLSEVCSSAQAAAAEKAITEDDEEAPDDEEEDAWEKV